MRTIFLPVGIDTYAPVEQAAPAANKNWFEDLPGVLTDTRQINELLISPPFQALGFKVEQRIFGTKLEVEAALQRALDLFGQLEADALIMLWSGHGECLPDGELRLPCRGDQTPIVGSNGYSPAELAKQLVATGARAVYLILDVCHAAAALTDIFNSFAKVWNSSIPRSRSLNLLCAAGTAARARDAGIVPILVQLLKHGPSAKAKEIFKRDGIGAWNTYDSHLSAVKLSSAAEIEAEAAGLPAPFTFAAGKELSLFPNPLYRKDAAPALADQARLAFLSVDAATHFLPKARGLDPTEPGWFFNGRVAVNRQIIGDLSEGSPVRLLVLTGGGGSGKSAILGRLAILSDRAAAYKAGWVELADGANDGTVPPPGWVSGAVHLRGLTVSQAIQHLSEILLGSEARSNSDVDVLIKGVSEKGYKQPLVILDALDESLEPGRISNDLSLALIRANWRVLLGTRRAATLHGETDLLGPFEKLTGSYKLIDLANEASTPADIAAYVANRLTQSPRSPYFNRPSTDADVHAITAEVSERAAGIFLYARITTDSLVRRAVPLNTAPGWADRELGSGLDGAFGKDLAEFDQAFQQKFANQSDFANVSDGATGLMRALAWGRGEGLPLWDEIWPRLASAVAGEPHCPYRREHAEWLLFEAGRYIVEAGESQQAVYRLFHQGLNDYFRRQADALQVEGTIFDQLSEIALVDRSSPNPYIRRYLAPHANAARRVNDIFSDAWLMAICEPFTRFCPPGTTPYIDAVAAVYRAVAHRFGSEPAFNAAHLLLGARLLGNEDLQHRVRSLGLALPFTAGWCDYVPPYPESLVFQDHYVASGHAAAWHPSGDLIALADLRGVRFFHPEDGTPASERIDLNLTQLVDIDWAMVEGKPVLAIATGNNLWLTGEDRIPGAISLPKDLRIRGLAWGRVCDRDLLAVIASDGMWTYVPAENTFTKVTPDIANPLAVCFWRRQGRSAFLVQVSEGIISSWDGDSVSPVARWETGVLPGTGVRRIAATGSGASEIIAILDAEAWLIDPSSGRLYRLKTNTEMRLPKTLAAFQDSSGARFVALASSDGIAVLHNLDTSQSRILDAHEYPIDDFAVFESKEETILVTAGDRVRRWWLAEVKNLSSPASHPRVDSVALTSFKGIEICGFSGETLRVLAPRAGQILAELSETPFAPPTFASPPPAPFPFALPPCESLTFATLGEKPILVATKTHRSSSCTAQAFDASDLHPIMAVEGETVSKLCKQLHDAGITLAVGSRFGDSVLGWSGNELVTIRPNTSFISVSGLDSGEELYQIANAREVACTLWNGELLIATAGIDGPIGLWNLPAAGSKSKTVVEAMPTLRGHEAAVWQLSFGKVDGRPMLASAGMESPRIWDLATRQNLVLEIDHRVQALALSDSGLLAVGTNRGLITVQLSANWVRNKQPAEIS